MRASRDQLMLALCLGLEALLFVLVAGAAREGASTWTILLALGASFGPYAGVLVYSRALRDTRGVDALVMLAVATLGAIWLFAPPTLSDDLYRYVWEGRLWLEGFNPYRLAPDDPALAPLRDELWRSINNKPLATIYPPLSQILFALGAKLGGGVLGMQALGLAALVAATGWTRKLTGNPRVALAVGLNPLLSSVSCLDGHLDVLVGAAFLTAAYALTHERFVSAAFAVCAAVGLKVVGLVALPFLWPRPKVLVGAAGLSALLLWPVWAFRTPTDPVSGASQFAMRWRGNESVFAALDWLSRALFPDSVAAIAPRIFAGLAMMCILAIVLSRRMRPASGIRIALWSVLLLSPQVHPWYLGWILPLELAAGGRAALIWSAAVLFAYAPLERWMSDGVWEMPLGLQLVEYAAVGVALVYDFRSNSKILS